MTNEFPEVDPTSVPAADEAVEVAQDDTGGQLGATDGESAPTTSPEIAMTSQYTPPPADDMAVDNPEDSVVDTTPTDFPETPPVAAPPVVTPPVVAPPVVTPPVVAPPVAARPVVSPPVVAPPAVSPPVVAPPAVSVPTPAEPPAQVKPVVHEAQPPVMPPLPDLSSTPAPTGGTNPKLRVFAVANQKGGVGKTTTTVNLGSCLAELGLRTLIVDLDPQANASTGLGINPRSIEASMYDVLLHETPPGGLCRSNVGEEPLLCTRKSRPCGAEIELVPAFNRERRLKLAIESVAEDYDYVLIDCPPSLGLLTVNGLTAATEVLVPIQCEYYALEGLGQLLRNVDLVKKNLNPELDLSTIVLVMFDARTKLASQVAKEVRDHFGPVVCRQVIPRSVRLSEAPSFGQPINVFDPKSRGALAYRDLAKEVSGVS